MTMTQNTQYLESKVLTASPQRLHLMLLEGSLRFGRQAEDALRRSDMDAAVAPLLRLLDIIGELLAGVRARKSGLNTKIADLYWYLFRQISLAKIHGDATMLGDVLKVIEYERQTWQLLCDKLEGGSSAPTPIRAPHSQIARVPTAGFTLEA